MNTVISVSFVLSLVALVSCQHTSEHWQLMEPQKLLVDETRFQGELYPVETAEEIFRLPQANKAELSALTSARLGMAERSTAILKYILAHTGDSLTYNHTVTRTVSETLATRQANCLSLSILTYSIAKEVGIGAVFQDVKIPEYWSSDTNQTWLNGHINLKLVQNRQLNYASGLVLLGSDIVIDFDRNTIKQRFATETIKPERVIAMFYNNKAAETFDHYNLAQTYRYYRAAIAADPDYAVTWSNLAVLYRQQNMYPLAEQAYHHSLALDPTSTNAMANLAVLYRYSGNISAAKKLEQQVHEKRKTNPWYYVMLGNEAVKRNELNQAIALFQQSLTLNNDTHEALFGLARSYFALNNTVKASHYLEKARRAAKSTEDKQRYQHKISVLNRIASAG
ncbi:tetratricopeptide repeat protein [Rheinheimera sp. NSM]|uniref:tetratricopeptide repeat protein n=1 Tax=Rheinheimera sp. NSM TaxID=3457884 RepID=UPI0040365890